MKVSFKVSVLSCFVNLNFIYLKVSIRTPAKKHKYVMLDYSSFKSENDNNISRKPKEKQKRVQKIIDRDDGNSNDEVVIVNEVEGKFPGQVKIFDKKAYIQ